MPPRLSPQEDLHNLCEETAFLLDVDRTRKEIKELSQPGVPVFIDKLSALVEAYKTLTCSAYNEVAGLYGAAYQARENNEENRFPNQVGITLKLQTILDNAGFVSA